MSWNSRPAAVAVSEARIKYCGTNTLRSESPIDRSAGVTLPAALWSGSNIPGREGGDFSCEYRK